MSLNDNTVLLINKLTSFISGLLSICGQGTQSGRWYRWL